MHYLHGTQNLTLTLELGDHPSWWMYSSYAIHHDMKSHSGIFMILGKCAPYTASTKQKLDTKSSMEAELVDIDDLKAQVLWTRQFLLFRGCTYLPQQSTRITRV